MQQQKTGGAPSVLVAVAAQGLQHSLLLRLAWLLVQVAVLLHLRGCSWFC